MTGWSFGHPARADDGNHAETLESLFQTFSQLFENEDYAAAADVMERTITAYDMAGHDNAFERASMAFYLAYSHFQAKNVQAALNAAQAGLNHQPALVTRYPELMWVQGWGQGQLGFFGQSAASYATAANLAESFKTNNPDQYGDEFIAALKVNAAYFDSRSSFIVSEKLNINPLRQALSDYEEILGAPAFGFRYDLARALAGHGYDTEARSSFLKLADAAPPEIASAALARLAILEWELGDRNAASIAAQVALDRDALPGTRANVMRVLLILSGASDLTESDLERAGDEIAAIAATPGPQVHENVVNVYEILMMLFDVLPDLLVVADEKKSLVDQLEPLLVSADVLFGSDTFTKHKISAIRLRLAEILESLGEDQRAQEIYQKISLSTETTAQLQAFAQAGLARLGVRVESELRNDIRTLSAFAKQAADYAEYYLTAIPTRSKALQSMQIERFSSVMEQSVDRAFDLFEAEMIHGPTDAPNVSNGFTQDGPFVFPWTTVVGSGYVSSASEGTYATYLEQVFRHIQLARQSSAARAIADMTARQSTGSDALAVILRRRDAIIQERLRVFKLNTKPKGDLFAQLAEIDQRLDEVEQELDAKFPEFRNHIAMRPLTLQEAKDLLHPGEALITYLVTDRGLHVFAITPEQVIWHRADTSDDWLQDVVFRLRTMLDPRGPLRAPTRGAMFLTPLEDDDPQDPLRFDLTLAHDLYSKVLGPILAHLQPEQTLIVAPDGPLQSLPFATLVAQPPDTDIQGNERFQQAHWAIRDNAFVTVPVPSTLRALRNAQQPNSRHGTFVGVGDPVFSHDPDWLKLAELPETKSELQTLNRIVAGDTGLLLLGDDANEIALGRLDLREAAVIAFATHGLMGGEAVGLSEPALALSPTEVFVSGMSGASDGLLTTSEISELSLNADWVLLSACNTAQGPGGEGSEGLSGLATAFFYAGAHRLIVSHWAVQSDATVALTTGMFRALSDQPDENTPSDTSAGRGALALRQSMLQMIDTPPVPHWSHPGIWAPFVVVGG